MGIDARSGRPASLPLLMPSKPSYCAQGLPPGPPMTLHWLTGVNALHEFGSAAPKVVQMPLPPAITEHSSAPLLKAGTPLGNGRLIEFGGAEAADIGAQIQHGASRCKGLILRAALAASLALD